MSTEITITPSSENDSVLEINCGSSSPKLEGSIDITPFNNIEVFRCTNNNITSFTGYDGKSELIDIYVNDNQLSGSILNLSGLTKLQRFFCFDNQISGPFPSLSGLYNLRFFSCFDNQISGPIPSLDGLSNLEFFSCFDNQISGPFPSLNGLEKLQFFSCHINQISGPIPSLDDLSNLEVLNCFNNQISGYTSSTLSSSLKTILLQNNQLTVSAVNSILSDLVDAGATAGLLNIGGSGNASPTGQGLTDKQTLITRGWTVTTN